MKNATRQELNVFAKESERLAVEVLRLQEVITQTQAAIQAAEIAHSKHVVHGCGALGFMSQSVAVCTYYNGKPGVYDDLVTLEFDLANFPDLREALRTTTAVGLLRCPGVRMTYIRRIDRLEVSFDTTEDAIAYIQKWGIKIALDREDTNNSARFLEQVQHLR